METESGFRMLCKCLWVAKLALLPSGGVLQSNVTEVLISLMQQIKVRKLPVLVLKYLPTAWALDRAHSAKDQMGLTTKGWISSDQQHLTKTQKLESSWSDRRQEYSWAVKPNTTKQANITTPVSLGQFGFHFVIFFLVCLGTKQTRVHFATYSYCLKICLLLCFSSNLPIMEFVRFLVKFQKLQDTCYQYKQ